MGVVAGVVQPPRAPAPDAAAVLPGQPAAEASRPGDTGPSLPAQEREAAAAPARSAPEGGGARPAPPTLELMRKAGLVLAPEGGMRMRLAEEFSVIHHQLLRTIRTMEPPAQGSGRSRRVILVTSARPGEGKTFCSLNIAASIAQGRSAPVLLVDVDGKRGSLSELLGLGGVPGLRLLAAEPAQSPIPLIVPTEQRHLSILPYGTPAPGAPTVPPGTTVAAAVQRLASLLPQHVIILDAPPCLSTSDPSSLAPVAGQVLMVVEAERTQRAEVEAALDLVEACPILQLMLNQARMNSADTFGAYGTYDGYGVYGGHGTTSAAGA